ncbi:MAG TPA: lytic murein transglycosylase, partial [Beijerinckiaceae bacterium]
MNTSPRHPERPIGWSRRGLSLGQALRAFGVVAAVALAGWWGAGPARAQPGKQTMSKVDAGAFRSFVGGLWPEAAARGVSRRTFDAALGSVSFDESLMRISAKQAEFVRPVWDYLNGAINQTRIDSGRQAAARHAALLADIERRYGADPYVVLSIWGMETSYGSFVGDKNVFRSLATLAYASERKDFFRGELLTALQILEQDADLASVMTGSWAGAMGHTQFMPSSFMKFAVDHDGDGHRNIWKSIPDALASTANYLVQHGWVRGMTWGYEVVLPKGFDVSPHEPQTARPFAQWASLGLRRADGQAMPTGGEGALLLPAGVHGPAFLVTSNFRVIRAYNNSAAYMLAVALLSDRIAGAGPLAAAWPRHHKPLTTAQA